MTDFMVLLLCQAFSYVYIGLPFISESLDISLTADILRRRCAGVVKCDSFDIVLMPQTVFFVSAMSEMSSRQGADERSSQPAAASRLNIAIAKRFAMGTGGLPLKKIRRAGRGAWQSHWSNKLLSGEKVWRKLMPSTGVAIISLSAQSLGCKECNRNECKQVRTTVWLK